MSTSTLTADNFLDIQKSTPSIDEFTNMIHSYQGAQGKNLSRGIVRWDTAQENVVFHYSLLGGEAVVWHQRVHIKVNQRITMVPAADAPLSYVFNYFFHANMPIRISDDCLFEHKSLIFCNDRGRYNFLMPEGYKGHILQIIISDQFLRNYLPKSSLNHPYVHKIINQLHQENLVIPSIPAYLHAELIKIADELNLDGKTASNKLQLLQLIAEFTAVFFQEYLQEQPRNGSIQFKSVFRKEVKNYFLAHLDKPFCGLDTLADYLSVSTSTLKRLCTKHLGQTALAYFKGLQMQQAQKYLQSGKYAVSDVSWKLGFSTVSNFVRTYKAVFGYPPGQDSKK